MKFLENEKLAQLTALMTDAIVGTGERVINGRVEAFTMKRAGTDKKLAHELGEKYQAEIQIVETEMAQHLNLQLRRKRSGSIGNHSGGSSRGGSVNGNGSVSGSVNGNGSVSSNGNRGHSVSGNGNGNGGRSRSGSVSGGRSRKASFSHNLPSYPSSPNVNKRVRIDTTQNSTGRRRSRSVSEPISKKTTAASSKSPMKSALRSRSESFDVKGSRSRSNSNSFIFGSSPLFTNSPLGDFHDSSAQRLMTDLILTLNASFPDYDFSSIRPSHIAHLPSLNVAINRTNEKLAELTTSTFSSASNVNTHNHTQGANFFSQLWNAIDDVIGMNDSEVYSYVPPQCDDDDDPLDFLKTLDGRSDSDSIVPLWTLNFFFVNKSMKRIVLFTCVQTMRNDTSSSGIDGGDDDDEDDIDGVNFVGYDDGVKEVLSYENYGMTHPGFRSSRENSALKDNYDDDDEDNDWKDFDMDADTLGQPAPSTTVA